MPPSAQSDKNAREMLRAWIAHQGLHCSLSLGSWDDDKECIAWGILLSDVARHVANGLHEKYGADTAASSRAIRESFNSELDSPTSEASGGFVPQ